MGQLLVTLGEQVESVATKDVGASVAGKLSVLGELLVEQGNLLMDRCEPR